MKYFRLRGTGVSPGIAIGQVFLTEQVIFTTRKEKITSARVKKELKRLDAAIERTR